MGHSVKLKSGIGLYILSYLLLGLLSLLGSSASAVRFQTEDDGGTRRTLYPEAVKNVVKRSDELKALAAMTPLAALFPYLELTDYVKGRKSANPLQAAKTSTSPFTGFLNEAAEILVAQSPSELQMPLRRMYYYGESVQESETLWRDSNGARHVRGSLLAGNLISVEIISGLNNSPNITKLHRLIAMIEIGQSYYAREMYSGSDYRLYFPVLDMLNKIVTGLFVDEVLTKMGTEAIRSEIELIKVAETVKASLQSDLLGRGYLQAKAMSWSMENYELRGSILVDWVRELRQMRDSKAKAIKGLSAIHEKIDALVRQELLTQEPERYFQLAGRARANGDDRGFRIASQLMVNRSTLPGSGPGSGPNCERSFIAR